MHQLLLAVTGMSPQVITETLYAIHHQGLAWPDELCLITTSIGKARLWQGLVEDGHLQALTAQLGRPPILFTEDQVLVVPNAQGQPVDDARSPQDHEALADFITQTVRQRSADPNLAIHASIAGGRKTMTFYLGYAMSLFGRAQDNLSHVLVSADYEGRRDFYYPTHEPTLLAKRPGDQKPLDARDAQVTLADIPFVRQRTQINQLLASDESARLSYRQLTQLINLGDTPAHIHIRINETRGTLHLSDSTQNGDICQIDFTDKCLPLAFYLLFVDATLNNENDITRPTDTHSAAEQTERNSLGKHLMQILYRLIEHPKAHQHTDWTQYSGAQLANRLLEHDHYLPLLGKSLSSRSLEALKNGLSRSQFDNLLTTLKKHLNQQLPNNLSQHLLPAPIAGIGGKHHKQQKGAGYQLPLTAAQITITH